MSPPKLPFVSVIVPVYNEEKTIEASIKSLLAIDYEFYEIIIVDDGSSDSTESIVQNYPVKYIKISNSGPSKARNVGVSHASGEIVAFIDGDCIVDKNWLTELVKPYFFSDTIASVGGIQLSKEEKSKVATGISRVFKTRIGSAGSTYCKTTQSRGYIEEMDHNPSCNTSYKKEIINEVGLYDEDLWPIEDVELDHRIRTSGYRIVNNPKAIVWHYRPSTIKSFFKMIKRYANARSVLGKKNRKLTSTIHYIPTIALIAFPFLLFSLGFVPSTRMPLLFLISSYSTLLFTNGIFYAFKDKKASYIYLLPLLIFLIHFGWAIGFLEGYLAKRTTVRGVKI